MPDIGETLRESRMRRRIDMAEVEAATKIRAKYLRALENEEWSLLPGPTYVRSFLRTYADYLELDSRALVEEYKQRYERSGGAETGGPGFGGLAGTRRPPGRRGRPRRRRLASLGPVMMVGAGVVALLVVFYLLGVSGTGDDEMPVTGGRQAPTPQPTPAGTGGKDKQHAKHERHRKPAAPTRVHLRLAATGDVYVCLIDESGKRLIDGETLHAGDRTDQYSAKRMRVNFGNANATMHVSGKDYPVAESSNPIGYELRPGHAPQRLPDAERPDCS